MNKLQPMFVLLLGLAVIACQNPNEQSSLTGANITDGGDQAKARAFQLDGMEVEIPLSEVPDVVMQAALAAVPGITLKEAEMDSEDGGLTYDLEGVLDGVEYEIEVSPDGEVLEVEIEGDDDDDDDHDD